MRTAKHRTWAVVVLAGAVHACSQDDGEAARAVLPPGAPSADTTGATPTEDPPVACEVKVASSKPPVVRELASVTFDVSVGAQATCTFEVQGTTRTVDCAAGTKLTGQDLGTGIHEVKVRAVRGAGAAVTCSTFVKVPEPSPCRYTYASGANRMVTTYRYDAVGRLVENVETWTAGQIGKLLREYAYEGASRRVATQLVSWSGFQGVPDTRKDLYTYHYEDGPIDASGEKLDLLRQLDFDYERNGSTDVRQTFLYDLEGRLTVIDQDDAPFQSLDVRYTRVYDEVTRRPLRQDSDLKADGSIEDSIVFTYDQLGVLRKQASKAAEWLFEYSCD